MKSSVRAAAVSFFFHVVRSRSQEGQAPTPYAIRDFSINSINSLGTKESSFVRVAVSHHIIQQQCHCSYYILLIRSAVVTQPFYNCTTVSGENYLQLESNIRVWYCCAINEVLKGSRAPPDEPTQALLPVCNCCSRSGEYIAFSIGRTRRFDRS